MQFLCFVVNLQKPINCPPKGVMMNNDSDSSYISCGKCHFFELSKNEEKENGLGQCHRYPPLDYSLVAKNIFGSLTRSGFWCGEYKPKGY